MVYDKRVSVRMPPKVIESIEKQVNEGHASNTSDFVLMAVRDKIKELSGACA